MVTFMPSFRLELEVLGLRPGFAPPVVLRTLLDHLAETGHHIDGHDLDVVAGTPRLYVRFVVPASNDADEDAARLSRMNQTMRQVARQASLDPGDGIDL